MTLYVTARGLGTSPIPYGTRTFQVDFDFIGHQLVVLSSDGGIGGFALRPQSVAAFYRRLMDAMAQLELRVDIHKRPNELPDPTLRFDRDEVHRAYDREYAERFWRVLVQADRVFKLFKLREFVLPYDAVRESDAPDDVLLDFLQTTYEAAANLGKWKPGQVGSRGAGAPPWSAQRGLTREPRSTTAAIGFRHL